MKSFFLFFAGAAGIAAYFIATRRAQLAATPAPVEDLAHKLQDAWADHHTVA